MRRSGFLAATLVALTVMAVPAAADPPTSGEGLGEVWEVVNPCSDTAETVVLEEYVPTFREHLHERGRITHGTIEVTGEGDWTGRGVDQGVELNVGETVFHKLIVTNEVTGQKFQFTIRGHFNAITGEWNFEPFPWTTRCIGNR